MRFEGYAQRDDMHKQTDTLSSFITDLSLNPYYQKNSGEIRSTEEAVAKKGTADSADCDCGRIGI